MSTTAANQITLLDIAKMNGSDKTVGLIDEAIRAHPEITAVPARTIKGINYKTLVRTAYPTVAFREANQGTAGSKSTYVNRTVSTYFLNPRWQFDRMIADAHEDGPEALLAIEASGQLEASMITMAKQFYYGADTTLGQSPDALGYPGLVSMYDSANLTVDAGGTTANTGTSVWAVKFGAQNVQWVFGMNGQMTPSDVMLQPATDANGNVYTAYVQEMAIRPGVQLGSLLGVGRIKKITADSGCTLTDAKLASLLALFRVGVRPDAFFMTRRARSQLQQSRTVTLFGQAGQKLKGSEMTLAPTPVSYEDIPIYATDAISDTEALV